LGEESGDSGCVREDSSSEEGASDGGMGRLIPLGTSGMGFHTLDDFDVMGRKVLLRIDINSPVDEKTLRLVDGSKIRQSVATLRELLDRNARVAIVAHQGRPGDYDYIPLNEHAAFMSQYLGRRIRYVDDITGPYALKAVDNLKDGEAILLKNVRFLPEEQAKRTPEEHAESQLVKTLAPKFDLYVNDAFASSHRSHASLVGFTVVLPSAAGRLMEREVTTLTTVFQKPKRPSTFIFGGTKFVDALPVLEKLADRENVDNIIVAGLAGYSFLWLLGTSIGSKTQKLASKDVTNEISERAKKLIEKHGKKIHLPVDAAVDDEGRRKECPLDQIPSDGAIMDIGPETIRKFRSIISASKTVFMSGPPGVFEKEAFCTGTYELFKEITSVEAFSVIGGGHSCAAANKFGFTDKISYVSTGGGALERLMLGKEMPVVEALRASAKKF
jgi:phosphoglycerate kinase